MSFIQDIGSSKHLFDGRYSHFTSQSSLPSRIYSITTVWDSTSLFLLKCGNRMLQSLQVGCWSSNSGPLIPFTSLLLVSLLNYSSMTERHPCYCFSFFGSWTYCIYLVYIIYSKIVVTNLTMNWLPLFIHCEDNWWFSLSQFVKLMYSFYLHFFYLWLWHCSIDLLIATNYFGSLNAFRFERIFAYMIF